MSTVYICLYEESALFQWLNCTAAILMDAIMLVIIGGERYIVCYLKKRTESEVFFFFLFFFFLGGGVHNLHFKNLRQNITICAILLMISSS